MNRPQADQPNPGSDAAVERGCTCPVMDNGRGRFPPYSPDGWWITGGCPLHDPNVPRDVADVVDEL